MPVEALPTSGREAKPAGAGTRWVGEEVVASLSTDSGDSANSNRSGV